ncbi:MAG: HAMP domain-containing histidine kinase [Rhodocyclales bacterium]|nr:HAMP domain-containing histidine kinase [Rhodocyclales bacterium]
MMARLSLRRRIIASFTLMTVVVAGAFSLAIKTTLNLAEINLAIETMERQISFIQSAHDQGVTPYLGPQTAYYKRSRDNPDNWPRWLSDLEDGFHEINRDEQELHVLIRTEGDIRHALTTTFDQFEARENAIETVTLLGFIASVIGALVLGALLARHVISPVVRLSRQVQHRDQLLKLAPPLAPDYAQDEVGKLASAFDHALGRLHDTLERERMFTSDVSHELRTPLMVIASSCELLLAEDAADERERNQIERILRSSREMHELVDTFLRLARTPGPDGSHAGERLAEVAEEQIQHWRDDAYARRLDLDLQVEAPDQGSYPASLLRTVISNLLRNALHYTDQGYVRLIVREGGFSVIDSGVGIPASDGERMFAPYTRGNPSRGDGTGIGLSLVQRICARQGWQIALRNRAEGGCEFRVTLSPNS